MSRCLENSLVFLGVDEHGCLQSLRNKTTGCEYVAQPGLDFWRLVYPTDDDQETIIAASQQEPDAVAEQGGVLIVRYPRLFDVTGRRVEAAFTYEVALDGEELAFTCAIENAAAPEIRELWFPLCGGLGSLGATPSESFLLYPESGGRRIWNPVHRVADRSAQPVRGVKPHFLREYYPGRASMQWLGLYGGQGSLYVGSHDSSLQTTALQAVLNVADRAERDTLSLGFIKYPFVKAGERWQSARFVVAVHSGKWHEDARRYRRFADTYQDHGRTKPAWVETMQGMHDIVMLHQNGRINLRYDQIPDVCQAAARAGLDVIKLTGWSAGGHDNRYPDFMPSDRLGGERAMVEQMRAAQAAGFRFVQYFHFVQMSPNSEFYRQHGEFCSMKGPAGNPFIDVFTWPGSGSIIGMNDRVQLINACVGAAPWKAHVLECVRRGVDWGVDSVFLDQTAGAPSSYLCFDARHGHANPALACGPAKVELSAQARDLLKQRNPEAALGAEYMADVILQYYDFTIPFGMGSFYGEQHFGEMYRYTFPEDIVCSQYMSREDCRQLHYSFVMGFRFFLAPRQQCDLVTALDPGFVRRLAALTQLRRKYADVMLRGRFLDVVPIAVGTDALVARAFDSAAGKVVAVWNPTPEAQPLAIAWPGHRMTGIDVVEGGSRIDPSDPVLGQDEVAVVTFA